LCDSVASASAAFLGSCNSFCELDQLSFPNEQDAAALFSDYSGLSLFSATQQDLQATLDKRLFDDLIVSFGIRDQARLMALAHPSGTSSGWLKAIP